MTLSQALLTLLRRYERLARDAEAAGDDVLADLHEQRRRSLSGLLGDRSRRATLESERFRRRDADRVRGDR